MIRAIAFDLDDTLLNTSGLLVPKAVLHSFQILIQNGLMLTLSECEQRRLEMIRKVSHKDVFQALAKDYGTAATVQSVPFAVQAFYEPVLPETLPLLPGARENINYLKTHYLLYVVTAGTEETQRNKAAALGITDDFKKIYVTNSLQKQRKENAFLDIIQSNSLKPEELLCVGNSLPSEIFDALKIGARACYFEFGEDRGPISKIKAEQPHFHIRHHHELINTCHL